MPRQARLDVPGTLHHVIIRGIERKETVRVGLVGLGSSLLLTLALNSYVLALSADRLAKSIKDTLEELNKLKEGLLPDSQDRFKILVHNAIPFGSAIMLDVFSGNGRIQIETKPYKAPLRKSFAIEVTNKGSNEIYSTLRDGYCQLLDEADSYDNFIRSDKGVL